jgi:predicted SprT family Zn-dependent metalloprotease
MEVDPESALEHLRRHYQSANSAKFDSILPVYGIALNPHLRRLTGRITYSERLIEISHFHLRHYGLDDAVATLEHEMLHLYLHTLRLPSGHNAYFKRYAAERAIRVFHSNPYPQNRLPRHRYVYECPACRRMVFRKRCRPPLTLACGVCCRNHARGAWDPRFALTLLHRVSFG